MEYGGARRANINRKPGVAWEPEKHLPAGMIDYNQIAQAYAQQRQVHPQVVQSLRTACGTGDGVRVLEVGCGTGNYIHQLALATDYLCYGLDLSPGMLQQARRQPSHVSYIQSRAEATGLAGAHFDLVFSVDVIHHVADLRAYFRETARILKPGGLVCTVTDSEWIIRNRVPLSSYFPATVELELQRYPAMGLLRDELLQAGFSGIREELVEFPYELRDAAAFRARTYSSLHLISQRDFEQGLAHLERDLASRSVRCVSRYVMLWGSRSR